VRRDRPFYEASGGGLTVSGGEPTVHLEFVLELFTAARAEGISTCLETCGMAPRRAYQRLLPLTDVFLFDYKATNSARHQELTGAPLEPILANLQWLHDNKAHIHVRCPLIPGQNDDPEHLDAVARLAERFPRLLSIERLPYHSHGEHKYALLGRASHGR